MKHHVPDGIVFAVPLMLAALILYPNRGRRFLLQTALFIVPGILYFLWRWHYFGYPLPNPFYKKGAGVLHLHSLRQSWRDLWELGLPFVLVLPVGLVKGPTRRLTAAALFAVLAFVVLWVLISDETNYVMRFRAPILPVILTAWVPGWQVLAGRLRTAHRTPAWAGATLALVASAGLAFWQHQRRKVDHRAHVEAGEIDDDLFRDFRGLHVEAHGVLDDVEHAATLQTGAVGVVLEVHHDIDADDAAFLDPIEIDVDRLVRHRVELDRARDHRLFVALVVERDHMRDELA